MSPDQNIFEAAPTTFALDEEEHKEHAIDAVAVPAADLFELPGFEDDPEPGAGSVRADIANGLPYLDESASAPRSDRLLSLGATSRRRLRQVATFAVFALAAFLVASVGMSVLRGSVRQVPTATSRTAPARTRAGTKRRVTARHHRELRRALRGPRRPAGLITARHSAIAPSASSPVNASPAGSAAPPLSTSPTASPAPVTPAPTYTPPPAPTASASPPASSASPPPPPDPEFSFER